MFFKKYYFIKIKKALQVNGKMEYFTDFFIIEAKNPIKAKKQAIELMGEHNGIKLLNIRKL